ncbi:acyl-CoA dehydrogenase family protein [Salinisphaera sp. Q1T1-3]|uniref:acyl-CoA dehydrogenase family protein n=1 Tax=Salinisphaera sp. Q1T1-3 TaxID=2321229 RepID=UPI000E72476C|nr:acyl-CoA dehydrogenase family protein [Salinisphaera sp. Q1T1-3]RJS95199.1 monooxygenase [Salinisphaera sp. Q1T1-3]
MAAPRTAADLSAPAAAQSTPPRTPGSADEAADWLAIADDVAARLDITAAERDAVGGHAAAERALIRGSGLLDLSIPAAIGGAGQSWATIHGVVRRLARADSAVAHVLAFHHLQIATVMLYATPDQQRRLLQRTVRENLFWGNALNPRDRRCRAYRHPSGGYVFNGDKSFCSGSVDADYLTVSAYDEASDALVIAAIPGDRAGLDIRGDWDAIGQRQTDSGSIGFNRVRITAEDVLLAADAPTTTRHQLRSCLAQLVLVNLYVGLAEGALATAREMTTTRARPWAAADVEAAIDDPYVQHRYGRLWVRLRAAQLLANHAAQAVDALFFRDGSISAAERGDAAIAVAEAKVAAHDISLEAGSELFELGGTATVARPRHLDRFWRNARTHTLHDPVDYKLRDLGRWAISGTYPEPTSYS